jgi:hypothetical protein
LLLEGNIDTKKLIEKTKPMGTILANWEDADITVQIPPDPFFFTCSVTFCTVKRSLEKGEATELQIIQSYRSDVSSNHSGNNRHNKRIE